MAVTPEPANGVVRFMTPMNYKVSDDNIQVATKQSQQCRRGPIELSREVDRERHFGGDLPPQTLLTPNSGLRTDRPPPMVSANKDVVQRLGFFNKESSSTATSVTQAPGQARHSLRTFRRENTTPAGQAMTARETTSHSVVHSPQLLHGAGTGSIAGPPGAGRATRSLSPVHQRTVSPPPAPNQGVATSIQIVPRMLKAPGPGGSLAGDVVRRSLSPVASVQTSPVPNADADALQRAFSAPRSLVPNAVVATAASAATNSGTAPTSVRTTIRPLTSHLNSNSNNKGSGSCAGRPLSVASTLHNSPTQVTTTTTIVGGSLCGLGARPRPTPTPRMSSAGASFHAPVGPPVVATPMTGTRITVGRAAPMNMTVPQAVAQSFASAPSSARATVHLPLRRPPTASVEVKEMSKTPNLTLDRGAGNDLLTADERRTSPPRCLKVPKFPEVPLAATSDQGSEANSILEGASASVPPAARAAIVSHERMTARPHLTQASASHTPALSTKEAGTNEAAEATAITFTPGVALRGWEVTHLQQQPSHQPPARSASPNTSRTDVIRPCPHPASMAAPPAAAVPLPANTVLSPKSAHPRTTPTSPNLCTAASGVPATSLTSPNPGTRSRAPAASPHRSSADNVTVLTVGDPSSPGPAGAEQVTSTSDKPYSPLPLRHSDHHDEVPNELKSVVEGGISAATDATTAASSSSSSSPGSGKVQQPSQQPSQPVHAALAAAESPVDTNIDRGCQQQQQQQQQQLHKETTNIQIPAWATAAAIGLQGKSGSMPLGRATIGVLPPHSQLQHQQQQQQQSHQQNHVVPQQPEQAQPHTYRHPQWPQQQFQQQHQHQQHHQQLPHQSHLSQVGSYPGTFVPTSMTSNFGPPRIAPTNGIGGMPRGTAASAAPPPGSSRLSMGARGIAQSTTTIYTPPANTTAAANKVGSASQLLPGSWVSSPGQAPHRQSMPVSREGTYATHGIAWTGSYSGDSSGSTRAGVASLSGLSRESSGHLHPGQMGIRASIKYAPVQWAGPMPVWSPNGHPPPPQTNQAMQSTCSNSSLHRAAGPVAVSAPVASYSPSGAGRPRTGRIAPRSPELSSKSDIDDTVAKALELRASKGSGFAKPAAATGDHPAESLQPTPRLIEPLRKTPGADRFPGIRERSSERRRFLV